MISESFRLKTVKSHLCAVKNSNRKNSNNEMQQKELEEADNNIFGIMIKHIVTGAEQTAANF